jgi:hypothetical protein
VPVTRDQARAFVAAHHRHAGPPVGWRFGVGLAVGGELRAVVIAGRPVSRHLDDGYTLEVTRLATLGDRNACTRLYGAACRAAAALGYRRVVTYTLASESGSSPAGAGFRRVADVRARESWANAERPRQAVTLWGDPVVPTARRVRWERTLDGA